MHKESAHAFSYLQQNLLSVHAALEVVHEISDARVEHQHEQVENQVGRLAQNVEGLRARVPAEIFARVGEKMRVNLRVHAVSVEGDDEMDGFGNDGKKGQKNQMQTELIGYSTKCTQLQLKQTHGTSQNVSASLFRRQHTHAPGSSTL